MNLSNLVHRTTVDRMKGYGQFCPVAKTAEIFAQRWTPLIVRELCFGPKRFTEIHGGVPLMSRALLVQRLAELEEAGVVATEPLAQGKLYRLTPAGEHLGGIVNLMSDWGQRHGQGRIAHEELDPTLLMWGMRRQIAQSELPDHQIVLRLEFRGIPRAFAARRYWWMIVRSDDVEVCLKDPGAEVDVVLSADLEAFVRVWMGHRGLAEAVAAGDIGLAGEPAKVGELKRVLRLPETPTPRILAFPPTA